MARFEHVVFVCTNQREADNPKGCCHRRGAEQLVDRLKELTHLHGKKGKVRVTHCGCLDMCAKGVAVAVFSESDSQAGAVQETWYSHATPADADALFEAHALQGERLERLAEPER